MMDAVVPAKGATASAETPDRSVVLVGAGERMVIADELADRALAAQLETVATQVLATARPARFHSSALIVILLGGGLGVAIFQSRLLLRPDLLC